MLKRIVFLAFLLSYELLMSAQDPFKPATHLGIHGGVNFSSVNFMPSVKQHMISSPAYGLVFRHVSEPHIGLQLEVNMAGKGWQEDLDSLGTYTRQLETFDFQALAVFIAGSKTLRLGFVIGPYASYLRDEKETIDIPNPADYRAYYTKPLINKGEFGFTGGMDIEVHTKLGMFAVKVTYSHSLTNIFPLNEGEFYYNGSRNQVIHVGLAYMIKL